MPIFDTPDHGVSHSEALKEAWAHASTDAVIQTTLEFVVTDALGAQTSGRVVNDHRPLEATLEAGAPLDPGATVTFQAVPFEFTRPPEGEGAPGEVQISVDNVSREVSGLLGQTAGSLEPVMVIVRDYLSSDTSAPHTDPPLTLELQGAQTTVDRVTARASFGQLGNTRFPRDVYDAARFPGLTAR